jgi:carbon monoxide dehydrogenase subunit G
MQLSSQRTLPVGLSAAWDALNDIQILKACIPGCESLTAISPDMYEVVVLAAVGPVKARFKGLLALRDIDPPNAYRIEFEGSGGPAGHGKGSAQIRLEASGAATTVLHYTATASVGGKIAQIGQRLVDMAAQRMAGEFFAQFETRLREVEPVEAPPAPAAPVRMGWFEAIRGWLRRLARRAASSAAR